MDSDESNLRVLVQKCAELEASQASLRARLNQLTRVDQLLLTSFPGNFRDGNPYSHVLQSMDHAVHVTTPSSREIIFWNRAAEKLYGWKDYEATGRCFWDLLIEEEYLPYMEPIWEKLHLGQSWSGQFPFKKRSGGTLMALVTHSPLYEDDELVGVITVSSDAEIHKNMKANQPGAPEDNTKRIQWQQRPQIASVPQMASSISDLASKVLGRIRRDDTSRDEEAYVSDAEDVVQIKQKIDVAKNDSQGKGSHAEESMLAQPAKVAAKFLAKFRKKSDGNNVQTSDGGPVQNGLGQQCFARNSKDITSNNYTGDVRHFPLPGNSAHVNENRKSYDLEKVPSLGVCYESFKEPILPKSLPVFGLHVNDKDANPELEEPKAAEREDASERLVGAKTSPSSGENFSGSAGSSSSKGDSESSSMVDSDIQWEDLQLGENIGQGSFAAVYHGLWNGSDVAIKVYFGRDYSEGTLLDYKKEIGIMRKLRHPNVLLFMGACYSQERLAIVTEFLPRGSLFKILHRSNQVLDLKRRLKMALDVARGMNYLHRRNPPIVHRDLKSSNLLVDKNWNVKVGDFGLSKLKNATFLTAKSGGGTPQWMAPEVLRNDRSNEKSDVFSFGVILWELVTVKIPWDNLNALQVIAVVGFMNSRLDLPEDTDPRISSIIKECWQSEPELRPSFEDIIQRMTGILQSMPAAAHPSVRKSLSLPSKEARTQL